MKSISIAIKAIPILLIVLFIFHLIAIAAYDYHGLGKIFFYLIVPLAFIQGVVLIKKGIARYKENTKIYFNLNVYGDMPNSEKSWLQLILVGIFAISCSLYLFNEILL